MSGQAGGGSRISETQDSVVPRHVAIIMDGNGRWAKSRGLPRHAGHKAGLDAVRRTVEACASAGIRTLTLFAFSSENWRRPQQEVGLLMDLFLTALKREVKRLNRNNVRLRIIGERSAFSERLQQRIAEAEAATSANDGLLLQIAANYGGRWDITQAARALCRQVAEGGLEPEQVDERRLASQLSSADLPDPDLFIRTGGEHRLSNFLLWQTAYSELYFTDRLWPEFDADCLRMALADYGRRQRRFGRTPEQLEEQTQS